MTYLENDIYIGRSLELYGEYSEGEVALFREFLRPGDTALDIGANVGALTLAMAGLVGPQGAVHAFEPQGAIFDLLHANVATNNLTQVVTHQKAVGEIVGTLSMPSPDYSQPNNFGAISLTETAGETVDVVAIDGLSLPALRLLKADVEGMEHAVILGARETIKRLQPVLYIENDRREKSKALIEALLALDYRLWWHIVPLFSDENFRGSRDNIFGNVVSCNMVGLPKTHASSLSLPAVTGPEDFFLDRSAAPARDHKQTTLIDRALALHRAGDIGGAEAIYRRVLATDGRDFDALHMLGVICGQHKEFTEAEELIRRALAVDQSVAFCFHNYGQVLTHLRRYAEAVDAFGKASALAPDNAQIHLDCGDACAQLHRSNDALENYNLALSLDASLADAWLGKARVLADLGRHEGSVAACDQALELRPDFPAAYCCRGLSLNGLGRFEEGTASYERALAEYNLALRLDPDRGETWLSKGQVLTELDRNDEAVAACDRALTLRPDFAEAHSCRGYALHCLGRFEEELASYDRALAIDPDLAAARFNRSLCQLLLGDFKEGWREYEWRWKAGAKPRPKSFAQPQLDAQSDVAGKTVLVHCEQGLGDTIQFCRYVEMLAQRGAEVILQVQPALKSLLADLTGAATVIGWDEERIPPFDLHGQLLSLPLVFETRIDTIPARVPYLEASPARLEHWSQHLPSSHGKPRAVIRWRGNPLPRRRSMPLEKLSPLFDLDWQFVSLQAPITEREREFLAAKGIIHVEGDWRDIASVLSLTDVVISIDTAIAHLAGALGVPTWVVLGSPAEWRWLLNRDDSPWYPTMRLFHQPTRGDWDGAVARLAKELKRYGENRSARL